MDAASSEEVELPSALYFEEKTAERKRPTLSFKASPGTGTPNNRTISTAFSSSRAATFIATCRPNRINCTPLASQSSMALSQESGRGPPKPLPGAASRCAHFAMSRDCLINEPSRRAKIGNVNFPSEVPPPALSSAGMPSRQRKGHSSKGFSVLTKSIPPDNKAHLGLSDHGENAMLTSSSCLLRAAQHAIRKVLSVRPCWGGA
mmetsp:Transcript_25566/g.51626  ORF Transcript_25566/g.51626 Transcript_25566/m.51626 type:complete len:204 (+) Transcript_25566:431-1042(+)